ncbi:MAG TPA: DUF72 domain-containing protein [Thermoleophilia bacterium]|nr:DUF72 domain-containing protein [Thermoleophilia bacterium]
MAKLYAGTSGYAYPTWKPGFYPEDLPSSRFLQHYAGRLTCVEINYTFRHMPSEKTAAAWAAATPPGFAFALKMHQRVTHANRLKEGARDSLDYFVRALGPLRDAGRLGPVLVQVPPNLRADPDRLARFLDWLPGDLRFAFEFREASWFTEEVYDLLRAHDAALCVADSESLTVPDVVTAGFAYYRHRLPQYDELALRRMRGRADELITEGRDVYVLFKHEDDPGGALEAERLLAA